MKEEEVYEAQLRIGRLRDLIEEMDDVNKKCESGGAVVGIDKAMRRAGNFVANCGSEDSVQSAREKCLQILHEIALEHSSRLEELGVEVDDDIKGWQA